MSGRFKKILITGAGGQIGTELTLALRQRYGAENVITSDIRTDVAQDVKEGGPFVQLDVTDRESLENLVKEHEIDAIFHMAAILSATGEKNPHLAWNVNIGGTYNVLEVAREHGVKMVFVPSSIAVFGPETPKVAPQETVLRPTTMYGITKVTGELLGNYYVHRFGVDVRGVRYPGIISAEMLPGGGTTDYAVEVFYRAIEEKRYTFFVRPDTRLPMMYMPDCLKATIQLAEADFERLKHHADFNVGSMSFSAEELAQEIKKHIPEFEYDFKPDFRQEIADSWPRSVDDSAAREEWDWQPEWDLPRMVEDMLAKLRKRYEEGNLYKGAK